MKGSKDAIRTARQLLKASFEGGRLDGARAVAIVRHLVARKPRGYRAVLGAYQRMVRLEVEKQQAVVETAADLAPGLRNQVAEDLRAKYGDGLAAEFKVNPELIGGMRVRVGSDVWDGSVRGRLARLQERVS